MGLRNKMVDKAAEKMGEQSSKLFNDIIRIQESMHGYLEKILEVQRDAYNYQRKMNGDKEITYEDKLQ